MLISYKMNVYACLIYILYRSMFSIQNFIKLTKDQINYEINNEILFVSFLIISLFSLI